MPRRGLGSVEAQGQGQGQGHQQMHVKQEVVPQQRINRGGHENNIAFPQYEVEAEYEAQYNSDPYAEDYHQGYNFAEFPNFLLVELHQSSK